VSHFSAGVYFLPGKKGRWSILGSTTVRYPNSVKLIGGTDKYHPGETKEETLGREFLEQAGIIPTVFFVIFTNGTVDHTKYFFLVLKAEGEFPGVRKVTKTDGESLTVRSWDLAEFEHRLFPNHRQAFTKAVMVLATFDRAFARNYPMLVNQKVVNRPSFVRRILSLARRLGRG
jgi:hypothetical protein